MDPIELSLFASRIEAICEEMGAALQRAAFSPNIKERLDFSCAVFDPQGRLISQAAHIPVHLGSMAYAMGDIVSNIAWDEGDQVILNDPYLGGTHLPDITLIAPFFFAGELTGFVANRAHHADIGARQPGSMPLCTRLEDEGIVIAPHKLYQQDHVDQDFLSGLLKHFKCRDQIQGDLSAQLGSNRRGLARLETLLSQLKIHGYNARCKALNDYAERLARAALQEIPRGTYCYTDYLDDDGQGNRDLAIRVAIKIEDGRIEVDFAGTAPQAPGNINCPLPVTASAVHYVFHCLMPANMPLCHGGFAMIGIKAPPGCIVNARRPAAVAAGNVETSTRIVDTLLGALAQAIPAKIPAASCGSMNNVAMGTEHWDYYETLAGGMGAHSAGAGLNAVQCHMTNTRNTPVEVLEMTYPLRITRYAIRGDSGGDGQHRGGDGILREYEFLNDTEVCLLTERRRRHPWGLAGGGKGLNGENRLNGELLPAKVAFKAKIGDHLCIATPGGGGWGLGIRNKAV